MNRLQFRRRLQQKPIWLDGAMGTELAKRGLPPGAAPESWVIDHPDVLSGIHREYMEAGAEIIYACTFGANRLKLADHGLARRAGEINRRIVEIAQAAAPGAWIFGDLSPTGKLLEPGGDFPFDDAVDVFRQQAEALDKAGVDGFVIETMLDAQEARAALLGVRAVAAGKPVMVSLTYESNRRTLFGTPPAAALVALQSLGADAVGCNCSSGPRDLLPLLEEMLPLARVPLLAKPNAGAPVAGADGRASYDTTVEEFADQLKVFAARGIRLLGGCCGTTPAHIRAARAAAESLSVPALPDHPQGLAAVGSHRKVFVFPAPGSAGGPLAVIGERINPTGKKKFQAELRAGDLSGIGRFAAGQQAAGADMLDVNVGLGGIDEPAVLRAAVQMLAPATDLPLSLDSADPAAMEAALRLYPGRALVNSVSAEARRLDELLPVAARYGAMLLLLPVGDNGVPATADARLALTRRLLESVDKFGYGPDDVLVDGLAMAVSADAGAGRETLDFLAACPREFGVRTVLGLSNVSFGLPGREWVNAAFMALAMERGLSAVIANPGALALAEVRVAADALLGRDPGLARLVDRLGRPSTATPAATSAKTSSRKTTEPAADNVGAPGAGDGPAAVQGARSAAEKAGEAVLRGEIASVARWVEAALAEGVPARTLVDKHLVPAITRAGAWFEQQKYYLPQLMLAGEAMSRAMAAAGPRLAEERAAAGANAASRGRVVMATVKGDVHDIGKNLVILMLRNHDYEVIDLGKDVAPAAVAAAAREHDADLVGLSALMTTTLPAMRDTIALLRNENIRAAIMVGGAATTPEYAKEIGADGHAPDAVEAVRLAGRLLAAAAPRK